MPGWSFLALKLAGPHTDVRSRCLNRAQELEGACASVLMGSDHVISMGQAAASPSSP